ncbi:MAG TPA: hypothetical protein EYP49_13415 [Anaerolineae bacterium]|nr:hypothetical protein [Anaerolineae bacterium]
MNDAITWEKFYVPILRQLPGRLNLKVYFLVADTTDIGQRHRALVLSLAYHKRSLPLIWHVEPGSKGHTGEDLQVELLKRLHTHLQFDGLVIFLGDSEFDGVKVQRQLDLQGWYYACRTSPSLYVYPDGEDGFPPGDLAPEPGSPEQQLDNVEFTTKHRYGPVSCYACWEEPHQEPLILIYNLPPGWLPRPTYKRRFWTEPLFGDCKEGGFRLSTSRMKHAERLGRLFLALAIAYVWMVCLGVRAICEGAADLVDRSNRRTLSIFKTGWRWFKRQIKLGHTVLIYLTLSGDFELPALKYL